MSVLACDIPDEGLLRAYAGQGANYTDCFEITVSGSVSFEAFIDAFYTTWLFRMERTVLAIGLRRRIRDADVRALAHEGAAAFAFWTVEGREEQQILLCDLYGNTRSYLAVEPLGAARTRLIFGSAVVARDGKPLGRLVKTLEPVHRVYSRGLLGLAARQFNDARP